MKKLLSIVVVGMSVLFNGMSANAIETKQFEMGMVGLSAINFVEGSLRWNWLNMKACTSDNTPAFRQPYFWYGCGGDPVSCWWDSGLIVCPTGTLRTTVIDVFVNSTSKIRIAMSGQWQYLNGRTYVSGVWNTVGSGCTGIYAGFSGGGNWGGASSLNTDVTQLQPACSYREYDEIVVFSSANDTIVYFTGTLTRADL